MKMCTLFLPEKWYDLLDDIIEKGFGANRSELMRLFIFKGFSDMYKMMKEMGEKGMNIRDLSEKLGVIDDIITDERRKAPKNKSKKISDENIE